MTSPIGSNNYFAHVTPLAHQNGARTFDTGLDNAGTGDSGAQQEPVRPTTPSSPLGNNVDTTA